MNECMVYVGMKRNMQREAKQFKQNNIFKKYAITKTYLSDSRALFDLFTLRKCVETKIINILKKNKLNN